MQILKDAKDLQGAYVTSMMKNGLKGILLGLCFAGGVALGEVEEGFVSIFDGKTFDGWKLSKGEEAFKIEDGAIVANGKPAHVFYVGGADGGKFKDFELRLEVMTKPTSNGGVFIHTDFQETGWPAKGYEVQVNNTQGDWRKSGGLYAVVDNKEPLEDNTWMQYVIVVEKGVVKVTINGKEIVNYTAPEGKSKLQEGGGLIGLQAHDPGSTVYYKNLRVRVIQ
jgi:hypothetical protein